MAIYFNIFHTLIQKEFIKETNYTRVKCLVFLAYTVARDCFAFFISKKKPSRINFEENILYVHIESQNNYTTISFLENYFNISYLYDGEESTYLKDFVYWDGYRTGKFNVNKYRFILQTLLSSGYSCTNFKVIDEYFEVYNNLDQLFSLGRVPSALFVVNDHNPFSRSLILACEKHKIPCYYYQHASVSKLFPPLTFTASFLYGNEAFSMYQNCGAIKGDVHLLGIAKFDEFEKEIRAKNNRHLLKNIGICFNTLDSLEKVIALSKYILNALPDINIIIRPHPRDQRKISDEILLNNSRVRFSNSNKEGVESFLVNLDVLIADKSSILLEGALMNVWPIQFTLNKNNEEHDYYCYRRKGVASYYRRSSELLKALQLGITESPFRERARDFDASIGSDYEFCVKEELVEIMESQYHFGKFKNNK